MLTADEWALTLWEFFLHFFKLRWVVERINGETLLERKIENTLGRRGRRPDAAQRHVDLMRSTVMAPRG
jgi:hypothetical protein